MAFIKFLFSGILCLLHHTHAENGPSKELSDKIALSFSLNNQPINLHLSKSEKTNQDFIDLIVTETTFNPNIQEKSYYKDYENKAVFIVTKVLKNDDDDVESNLYYGFFEHGNKVYTIQPANGETDVVKVEGTDYFVKEFIAEENGHSNELSDEILLNFFLNNQAINLHLTENEKTNQELVNLVIAETNFNPNNQEKRFYDDYENNSVFIVTTVLKDGVESNLYHGIFGHENKLYTLQPANGETEVVKLEGKDYFVKEFTSKGN